jgi:hypothetical protein
MPGAQSQECQRKANLIVEVAGAFERAITRAQYLCYHFFGRGFPHAAGNADHANIELATPVTRDLLKCSDRVIHAQTQRRNQSLAGEVIHRFNGTQVEGTEGRVYIPLD